MAKRRPTKPDDMEAELADLKRQLTRQDKLLEEINNIVSGNSSYRIRGIRDVIGGVEQKMDHIDAKVNTLDKKITEITDGKGKWVIRLNNIPTAVTAIVLFIGSILSIILAVKELFTK
jgi:hypothetical protein